MACWYVLSSNKCNLWRFCSSCRQGYLCVDMSSMPKCHDISTYIVVDKSTNFHPLIYSVFNFIYIYMYFIDLWVIYVCQRSRLRCPISKIRMVLLMDAKIWMTSLMIMFAVRPTCVQDSLFKMSSESPVCVCKAGNFVWLSTQLDKWFFRLAHVYFPSSIHHFFGVHINS